ncbi:MAG: 3-methyl-2-oxobutanoate dehydrogenase subunit VorB [Lentisphaerae bacterium]|nr:3-methyl-2-oxobutanoate dehydrogenase subunit VorB [Lentisphaerota bacterium]
MAERVLMTGNDAVGEGAIRAGCDCYYGYPITPQNELTAYMAAHMLARGRVFIQAESELAAVSMVFGSAAAGKRAMTTSSSPGISLKQEGISYLAGCKLPAVIVNIQRGGPGLGNIAPSQADYFQAVKGGGHGDYHQIVLAPDSVQEMHDLTVLAFELADRYRTPVMLLADGRLGQMMEPLVLRAAPPPAVPPKPWALTGAAGRAPNSIRSLYLQEGRLEQLNLELQETYREIASREVRFEERCVDDADILLVAYGTCARIAKGVINRGRADGLKLGLFRPVSLWPFPYDRLKALAGRVRAILVVEMSAGQMLEDVRLAVAERVPVAFEGRLGGEVPTESDILKHVRGLFAQTQTRNLEPEP